ncbi:MAG: penicillin-binding protein activator [Methylobacter sp.]|uniref:Penicillin-binding protein activator n=1 Tax=Candidatus Methylobacter titanis TaxID=3053457 RepID=A0AA43Q6E4_9GAMM|nr:penicillin-binding protein activator [Candidatus Methylobacter titanis]MDI1291991.1 penicillin-binding protein activator [Candidatus Methylobacter titanis]
MRPKYKPPLLFVLLPLFFSGCSTTPASNAIAEQPALTTRPLIRNDRPEQMVELYQHPNAPSFSEQHQQHLQAIESLIQVGDGTTAKKSADTINPAELSTEQRTHLSLLYAQILLSFGEAEQAIESLAQIQPQRLNADNQIKYFQSQAFAYSLTGNLLDSAKSRIELHKLLTSADELEKNQSAILEALRLLSDTDLQTDQTDALAGWMSLAQILKYLNQPDFNSQISQWRASFPTHPADLRFLNNSQDVSENAHSQPKVIALLLPESGAFVQAGKAIRAGFMAAYNHADNTTKSTITFYDSEQSTPQALYNQAVSEGAELIIGPLAKEQLQSLADSVSFTVPVLALNHIPGLQKNRLYQFSLSPLDDTGQITHKAWEDGHQKVLLLVPENAPGKRIANYLTEDWKNQDGTILETQTYNPKEKDFATPVQKLLNLDESEQRYHKIRALIPEVKYSPRKRQDADAVLLSAYSSEARSINPQLQFYQSEDLPIYAMPAVYTGQINASLDADLNKITFCDIPWLFNKAYQGELGIDALQETWKQFPLAYLRLIAMGIDAYSLATRLNNLETYPYPGATGKLSLTTDQRIQRELTCAKFIDGQPEITGFTNDYGNTAPTADTGQKQLDHAVY